MTPGAYRITARSCPVQWQGTSGTDARMSCPAGQRRILTVDPFQGGSRAAIGSVEDNLDLVRRSDYRVIEINRGQIVYDSAEGAAAMTPAPPPPAGPQV